jgi:hypothetical protein
VHRGEVLLQHVLERATALGHVPPDATDEPQVRWRIDEHLQVEQRSQRRPPQREQSLDDHEPGGRDRLDAAPGVRRERVDRLVHGLAAREPAEMIGEQRHVDRGRLVVIDAIPLGRRESAAVEVVGVEVDHAAADAVDERAHDRALPRAGAARHADH